MPSLSVRKDKGQRRGGRPRKPGPRVEGGQLIDSRAGAHRTCDRRVLARMRAGESRFRGDLIRTRFGYAPEIRYDEKSLITLLQCVALPCLPCFLLLLQHPLTNENFRLLELPALDPGPCFHT